MRRESTPHAMGALAGQGSFQTRSSLAGFVLSVKSLFWPVASQPGDPAATAGSPPAPSLSRLPAMPASMASRTGEDPAPQPSAQVRSFRRIAGSAGRWKKRLGEAHETWPRASMDELIATDGHVPQLVGLIQARYGLSHETASLEVQKFFSGTGDG